MLLNYLLYTFALVLFFYIVVNIAQTRKFQIGDAIATLGIVISIIVAQSSDSPLIIQQNPTSIPNIVVVPPTSEASQPNPTVVSSQFNTLVFSDDLENENKNFLLGGGSGSFNVVDDGTGNKVLELSDAGLYSLLVTFGPKNISNCAIEYRVKIVSLDNKQYDSGIVNLFLKYTEFGGQMVAFSLDPYNQYTLFYYYPPFEKIQGAQIKVVTGKWYDIRIEMDGENLFASIDGVPVIKTTDSRLISGNFGFQIYSNTTADFDDVKIWTR